RALPARTEREAADGRAAAGKESLARRQVTNDLTLLDALETVRRANPTTEGDHQATGSWQLAIEKPLRVCFDKADFRSQRPHGQIGVKDERVPARRIEQFVTGVVDERPGQLRQAHLGKQFV